MKRLYCALITVLTTALCATVVLAADTAPQKGTFALGGGTPQISSFLLNDASAAGSVLEIIQYRAGTKRPIKAYTVAQTKLMHLIVVRDDFREFQHVHPAFNAATGEFTQPIALASGHRYYAFADTTPAGGSQQVFRFTLRSGVPPSTQTTTLAASLPTAAAGPYLVRLSSTRLTAGKPATIQVGISKAGQPATDLRSYLGAAAHAVFINTGTLQYLHVHPMDAARAADMAHMKGMMDTEMADLPPNTHISSAMQLDVPALPRGAYKLWLQFRGGSTVFTAPFTIVAR